MEIITKTVGRFRARRRREGGRRRPLQCPIQIESLELRPALAGVAGLLDTFSVTISGGYGGGVSVPIS